MAQGGRWRANTGSKVTRTQSPIILDHIYITQPALSTEGTSNYAITVTRDPGQCGAGEQCIVQTRIKQVTVKPTESLKKANTFRYKVTGDTKCRVVTSIDANG